MIRPTLHNADLLMGLDLLAGDTLMINKADEIIAQAGRVLPGADRKQSLGVPVLDEAGLLALLVSGT